MIENNRKLHNFKGICSVIDSLKNNKNSLRQKDPGATIGLPSLFNHYNIIFI